MPDKGPYDVTLDELERQAHVPREDQVEEQDVDPPHEVVAAEELDRQRLLGITGAGRLRIRQPATGGEQESGERTANVA